MYYTLSLTRGVGVLPTTTIAKWKMTSSFYFFFFLSGRESSSSSRVFFIVHCHLAVAPCSGSPMRPRSPAEAPPLSVRYPYPVAPLPACHHRSPSPPAEAPPHHALPKPCRRATPTIGASLALPGPAMVAPPRVGVPMFGRGHALRPSRLQRMELIGGR